MNDNLRTVTMTGADDSISPSELTPISKIYPFVEWGVLVSLSSTGGLRFPSTEWLKEFASIAEANKLNVSIHLCGKFVRDVCGGNWNDVLCFPGFDLLSGVANRIQLNFHSYQHLLSDDFIRRIGYHWDKPIIFQMDGVNTDLVNEAKDGGVNASPLFDLSGGAGVLPESWPSYIDGMYCGYAGGLGPDCLAKELPKISMSAGNNPYWIDMETKVRSDRDRLFDLDKVSECLKIASS